MIQTCEKFHVNVRIDLTYVKHQKWHLITGFSSFFLVAKSDDTNLTRRTTLNVLPGLASQVKLTVRFKFDNVSYQSFGGSEA